VTLTTADLIDIRQLLATYGLVVDDHLWDRVDEVFAEDFVFDQSAFGIPDLHGAADVIATFKGRNLYAHHTTDVVITEDVDGTVSVHSKWIGFPNEGPPRSGDYLDVVVRTDAGWRLRRRSAVVRERKFFD
jgi:hypothetical protein